MEVVASSQYEAQPCGCIRPVRICNSDKGASLVEDVQAAESLLLRVLDWDGQFTEGPVPGSVIFYQMLFEHRCM